MGCTEILVREVLLQGIRNIGLEGCSLETGSYVLVHYGLVVEAIDKLIRNQLITDQSKLEKLGEACAQVPNLNCDDLRNR